MTKPPKNLGDNFWLKKGTFQTVPNSHAVCFTCHNADSGIPPESKDCHGCHKLLPSEQKLRVDFDPKLAADMGITDKTILRRLEQANFCRGFQARRRRASDSELHGMSQRHRDEHARYTGH